MKLYKLQDNRFIRREHFASPFSYFVIESIIEGNTAADVYVDALECPTITIVWDTKYSILCGGKSDSTTLLKAIQFIKDYILTETIRKDRGATKVLFENDEWRKALLEAMEEWNPNAYPRSVYRHSLECIPNPAHGGLEADIKQINLEMLHDENLGNVQGLVEELKQMWGTPENFLSGGFGFCAVEDNAIAAWCTGEYFSKNWCGIGVETYEGYQQKGLATALTIRILKHCKEEGKVPHWDCWKNNLPSVKTAEKTGFEKLADYDIVFLRFS